MNLQDIANLVSVRNFLVSSIDNLHIRLSREEIKNIQQRLQLIDKTIIEQSIKLDLLKLARETHTVVREFSAESTEDTRTVLEKFPSHTISVAQQSTPFPTNIELMGQMKLDDTDITKDSEEVK